MSFILLTFGMMLGFSTKILAQYGAIVYQLITGKVYAEETKQPISNIYIGNLGTDSVFTTENGEFSIDATLPWGNNKHSLLIKDIDGELNGSYSPTVKTFSFSDKKKLNLEIFMKNEPSISELIKKNKIPTKVNGKKINYKKIVYIKGDYLKVLIRPKQKYNYLNVYLNDKKLTSGQVIKQPIDFIIKDLKEVNYFFVEDLQNNTRTQMFSVEFISELGTYKEELFLKENENEGVIIIFTD